MRSHALALGFTLLAATPAFSHVTIEQQDATIGGPTKITLRVPHGCDEQPTVKLRLLIPEGFIAAKPMPKAGWALDVSQGAYATSHDYFHGVKLSEGAEPIPFRHMERVRVTLINDTMMPHPIHLHGHFFQLVTGEDAAHNPRKHTVNVLPGGKISFDLTADALGDWAFHCHMLMHMHSGMMRVVTVRRGGEMT